MVYSDRNTSQFLFLLQHVNSFGESTPETLWSHCCSQWCGTSFSSYTPISSQICVLLSGFWLCKRKKKIYRTILNYGDILLFYLNSPSSQRSRIYYDCDFLCWDEATEGNCSRSKDSRVPSQLSPVYIKTSPWGLHNRAPHGVLQLSNVGGETSVWLLVSTLLSLRPLLTAHYSIGGLKWRSINRKRGGSSQLSSFFTTTGWFIDHITAAAEMNLTIWSKSNA